MAFSEELKLAVKKKAMFQCCRCHALSVEVHHIIPQHENGPDTFDNAAPLCPSCHESFGDNRRKRKEIKEMRDNWYEAVERMYGEKVENLLPFFGKVNQTLEEMSKDQSKSQRDIGEIKSALKEISNSVIDNITMGTANVTASNIALASGASLSNLKLEDMSKLILCGECGESVIVGRYSSNVCPHCGAYININ